MIGLGRFGLAYVFFAASGLWAMGYFLTMSVSGAIKTFASAVTIAVLVYFIVFTHNSWYDEELKKLSGRLIPAHDAYMNLSCEKQVPDGVMFIFGNSEIVTNDFPHTILSVWHNPVLVLDRDEHGLGITLTVRSSDSRVIAELNHGEFVINQNNILQTKRPDLSTLSVVDQYGVEVLYVRYRNKKEIKFSSVLRYPGIRHPIDIAALISGLCMLSLKPYAKTGADFSVVP